MAERLRITDPLEFRSRVYLPEFVDLGFGEQAPITKAERERVRVYLRGDKPLDAAALVELGPILTKMPETRKLVVETVRATR